MKNTLANMKSEIKQKYRIRHQKQRRNLTIRIKKLQKIIQQYEKKLSLIEKRTSRYYENKFQEDLKKKWKNHIQGKYFSNYFFFLDLAWQVSI